jgi:hypothetical protein
MRAILLLPLLLVLEAAVADVRQGNFGAEAPAARQEPKPATPGKRSTYPFSGELDLHDATSITLKGKKKPRVLLLTAETRVMRNGRRARLADAAPGERVSGSTRKNSEGKEEALTVNLKGVPPPKN